jgi:glycosyltransferase involved in cell wall biosynthesis
MTPNAPKKGVPAYTTSAVIPTRNRPELVCRAIESVLRQTSADIEIVVVIDGPDPLTARALERFAYCPHLRVEHLPGSVGGGEARNIGVRSARGCWIAFLDDDDEWLDTKVQVQLQLALEAKSHDVVVLSNFVVRRSGAQDMVRPQRMPRRAEPLSEYLFKPGCGFQTSVFFASRSLLLRIPFAKGLRKHQDWDWLLRVAADPDVTLRMSDQALAIWYDLCTPDRVSSGSDWEFSLSWLRNNAHLFTRAAYSAFVAKVCLPAAVAQGQGWRTLWQLGGIFLFEGRPSIASALIFVTKCILPQPLIHKWRDPLIAAVVRPARGQTTDASGLTST